MMKTLYPAPKNLSKPEKQSPREMINDADIYVSVSGNDGAAGTKEAPLASFFAARDTARKLRAEGKTGTIKIAVGAGQYRMNGFTLGKEDSDTEWRVLGDGEVMIDGGLHISDEGIVPLTDDEKARLHGDAAEKVVKIDLKKYGLTEKDWDIIYPVGCYATADRYDGAPTGTGCEVFCNGQRMSLARYPNEGEYLRLSGVMDQGEPNEFPPQNYCHKYSSLRNPKPGAYVIDYNTNMRLKNWKSYEDIWMFGWFYFDWADASTPVESFDPDIRLVRPKYVANYGAREGALYYFFNVFDELDVPGEYYIDRKNGFLYVYPTAENAEIDMSLTLDPLIRADGTDKLVLDGFTFRGTRANALEIRGDDCVIENCGIYAVYGDAIHLNGYRNTVRFCEISHVGKGGIIMSSGDRANQISGDSRIENNLIHDWAEVYMTYQAAICFHGVGFHVAHNEMYNAPHAAVLYGGNDNIFEYNLIHDTVRLSGDAGAIYSGGSWLDYGNILRYNCIYNTDGDENHCPGAAIYWDDSLAGQTAYGNAIINISQQAFLIGGGRSDKVYNNLIANSDGYNIQYDDRTRDGALHLGWAHAAYENPEGGAWTQLNDPCLEKPVWKEKYPQIFEIIKDFDRCDEPEWGCNPTYAEVCGNLCIHDHYGDLGYLAESVYTYGKVENNHVFREPADAGMSGISEGDYTIPADSEAAKALPDFEPIPYPEIGRKFMRK